MTTMTSIVMPKQKIGLNSAVLVVLGSLVLAASSYITIPLEPVPINLQTFAVLLVGMLYGWRLGLATVLLFLLEGAAGLPVFTPGASVLSYGYILGFVPAVVICGYLLEKGCAKSVWLTFASGFLADSVIFLFGILWLSYFVGMQKAIAFGLMPFVLVDFLKLVVFAFVIPKFWHQKK